METFTFEQLPQAISQLHEKATRAFDSKSNKQISGQAEMNRCGSPCRYLSQK